MSTKELAFAASTIWVIFAAVLVIFMQAGFAFLEAGLTRMKNVGHIAAKNVLILAIASRTPSASSSRTMNVISALGRKRDSNRRPRYSCVIPFSRP